MLGGVNKFECLSGNLSDINREGLWIVHYDIDHNPNATDFPSSFGDVIFFQDTIDGYIYRELFAFSVGNTCYHRRAWAGNWTSWKEISTDIPAFYKDYSTLAGLADGMGALIKRVSVDDFNDAREFGIYFRWSVNVPHAPITQSSIFYLIVIPYSTDAILQLCYAQETHILYHRTYYVGTWTNWFAVSNT